MSSAVVSTASSGTIVVPIYAALTGVLLDGVLMTSSAVPEMESAEGEAFLITRADRVTASSMVQGRTVIVPIGAPEEGTIVDCFSEHMPDGFSHDQRVPWRAFYVSGDFRICNLHGHLPIAGGIDGQIPYAGVFCGCHRRPTGGDDAEDWDLHGGGGSSSR